MQTTDAADPRLTWSAKGADTAGPPVLRHRRDGILPAVAAALSIRDEVLTCTGSKAEQAPALHPVIQDFLDTLPVAQRERFTGRCPEPVLLSRFLSAADASRSKRAARKPLTQSEARKALRGARLTARRIREDGDPEHGSYAPPCRSCGPLLAHFGVRAIDPSAEAA
ncbi:YwqJ-related putative deaminase [Streptomyces sp. H39-S7]|uniref:YwqJ-related putative deaminase n=1 Tax=Streptomyces sp. H39-S7 TaxID=3004357 RepID=UPI0022AFA8C7|nr:YwqJ-related putative deaminase [Streptomyces sp. H39-S7]MCZ4125204.1 YwqJ-related putative deaminase [Streptomyces sp. H39-S7]